MQSIKRDVYLQRLKDREQNGLVKIITGIRRCGKSYLLNTLFYEYLKEKGINGYCNQWLTNCNPTGGGLLL